MVTLHFLVPAASALGWLAALRHAIRTPPAECLPEPQCCPPGTARDTPLGGPCPERRVRVYVNPVSGAGKGREVWFGQCKPILQSAGMSVEDVVTVRSAHATEDLLHIPTAILARYEGVVGVGGDGILAEVVQGIMQRPDWRRLLAPADGGAAVGAPIGMAVAATRMPVDPSLLQPAALALPDLASGAPSIPSFWDSANSEASQAPLLSPLAAAHQTAQGTETHVAGLHQPLRIGILPAGSGNGLVCSLLAAAGLSYSAENAALVIAKGWQCPLDVASTFVDGKTTGSGAQMGTICKPKSTKAIALLSTGPRERTATGPNGSHGFPLTSAGGALGAAHSLAGAGSGDGAGASPTPNNPLSSSTVGLEIKDYGASVIADDDDSMHEGSDSRVYQFLSTSWGIVSDLDIESEKLRFFGNLRFDIYGFIRSICLRKYRGKLQFLPPGAALTPSSSSFSGWNNAAHAVQKGPPPLHHLLPFSEAVPATWKCIEGVFTLLWITNTTHQSIGVACAPGSSHHDGVFTICAIRNSSPFTMMSVLLSLDEKGSFLRHPAVETFECIAFRLEPNGGGRAGCGFGGRGHISLDGEDMPYGPIQAEIHSRLLTLYGPTKHKTESES
jgi:diacylglycerol kinase family enzyme